MNLTFAKCESIVKTLPIGYYTGTRIEISVDKEAETSFYSPMENKIVISYPIIALRMQNIKDGTCDEEEAVRSMLYHEVSHAILTPAKNLNNNFKINCFEDERIETVLRNYFHNVNFRKQLFDIHGGHIPKAVDAKSAFFNAVRFGTGTAKVQKEVNRLLEKYAPMNCNTQRYNPKPCAYEYECEIEHLFELIRKEWKTDPDAFNEQENNGNSQMTEMDSFSSENQNGKGEQKQSKAKSGEQGEGEGEEKNGQNDGNDADKQGDEGQECNNDSSSENPYKGEPHESPFTPEQLKKMVGASLGTAPDLSSAQVEKLADFQKSVEMIIGNFNKKNKGGSGINTYSGVFNPRAVMRKDYRFFERSMSTQGNNKFGTCHLNLIIDCSGSFCDNVPLTNGILKVLSEVERKNRNFSMDVAFINHQFHLCESVRERKMEAWGGNDIPDNMKEIMMKLQKPQTCNYNIILFDGDAICNRYGRYDPYKLFGVFDMKQTTLITDPENKQYMNPAFTSAKVVITKNYTKELIDHILHALTVAFG